MLETEGDFMNKILNFPKPALDAPAKHFSYVKLNFEPGYEASARQLTAGRLGDKPQDKLIYAFITMNPVTGCAVEFGWASGRKDPWCVLDLAPEALVFQYGLEEANKKIIERKAFIETLKEQYYEQGFEHGGSADEDRYDGGFPEFAQNFERATGRRLAPAVAALLRGELRATA